ncbi:translation initiation factor IF-2 subunit gamma [Candidatus Parvarchaeota archaeon]|jgi:translation initiation factor 2 subunit 3|nr:MAG: translation initiation factor IF-2 subunit gamma [Candidatus Parvarchaeota archaeon]HIG52020.1 translation initiation factor IF-2 subunit gamma [Candidatus Pacearchaeota archaeon]
MDENLSKLDTLNVIIAGHIDHGKTTLLEKLSGKWTDTHSEELKRGITIKLGYADKIIYKDKKYNIENKGKPQRYVSFIDAPGHEMLMATMLSGAAIVDAAILVIAVNEGIKPQTKEHLMALQAKDIRNIIVIQNKIDLVDIEKVKKNYQELKKLFKGTIAENATIIPISAQQGVNMDKIFEELCKITIPKRNPKDNPIFLVARSFDINKPGTNPSELKGTVLGGTLREGILKKGDVIEIKPGISIKEQDKISYQTIKTKIIGLHKGSYEVSELTPGGSSSIETELDMSVGKTDFLSGCVASLEGKLPEITYDLKFKYSLFKEIAGIDDEIKLKSTDVLMISANTSVTVGSIRKITPKEIELKIKIPLINFKNSKIGVAKNINGHWRLIGYGEII